MRFQTFFRTARIACRIARIACRSLFVDIGKSLYSIIPRRKNPESLSLYFALQQLHIMTVVFHRLSILIVCLLDFYVRAATERYIIYPKSDVPLPARRLFTEKLNELAPQGNVYTSFWRQVVIRFWCADLNETAYEALLENPIVADIHVNKVVIDLFTQNQSMGENGTYLFRPISGMTPSNLSASEENFKYSTQYSPVAAELRALSQPLDSDSISHYPNYVYPIGRKQIYIYHVEFGINEKHDDFRDRKIEWLWTELAKEGGIKTKTDAYARGGHSTCTASKAVGNLYGASKRATLVVVKMPSFEEDSVHEVLDTVIDGIIDNRRKATSVVNISWGLKEPMQRALLTTLGKKLFTQIQRLMAMGVTIVCAAGNKALQLDDHGRPRETVDTLPAGLWNRGFPGSEKQFFVVGNSDINGARHGTSQIAVSSYKPQIYAPGVDIKCANSTALTGYTTWTGTSFSGVIADLMSTGQYDPKRPFWWQRRGGHSVVWNLVTKANNPPVSPSGNATLVNYTSSILTTTNSDTDGLDNEQLEQLDLSTD
ncbi:hypothetical protein JMJ35_007535 [Cladonia borealis]|uniref:Peptidase S8/S53 domain-containing protein n=1 Tax=Cladonia borealis TaxID=184061 RepID=A0AA39QYG8_9LECA|nr:hypothetical protein JMJ35_007535 [Cladonia borealis]